MKKNKKLLLLLGTVATALVPIATIISCGSSNSEDNGESGEGEGAGGGESGGAGEGGAGEGGAGTGVRPASIRDRVDASELKKWLDADAAGAKEFVALTPEKVGAITIDDLKKSAAGDPTLDADKKATIGLIEKALQTFAFETNDGVGGRELNTFNKENAFSAFISSSGSRSPFVTEESAGSTTHDREDLGFYPRRDDTGIIRLLDTTAGDDTGEWNSENSIADTSGDQRIFDYSYNGQNPFSIIDTGATAYSVIRSRINGKDVVEKNDGTGVIFKEKEVIHKELSPNLTLTVDGKDFTDLSDDASGEWDSHFVDALNKVPASDAAASIKIKVASGKKWAKSKDGSVVESTEDFKAADFITGLIRTLYASAEVRKSGTINGVDTGLKPLDEATEKILDDEFDAPIDAQNLYLLNLYGVDVKATVEANTTNGVVNADEDSFEIVFKKGKAIGTTALGLLTDSNLVTPISTDRIISLAGSNTDLGSQYGLTTYGLNEKKGEAGFNTDTTLSVAPYLWTKYDLADANGETVIKYNTFGGYTPIVDQVGGTDREAIKTFTTKIKKSATDPSVYPQQRADAFVAADKTKVWLLNSEVLAEKSILDTLTKYISIKHISSAKKTGVNEMVWVPYQGATSEKSGFNDLGRKLFYGSTDVADTSTKGTAIDEFYAGTGAETRAIINEAINWFTVAQGYFPSQHKTFTANTVGNDWLDESNLKDPSDRWTSYIDPIDTLEKIYHDNQGNIDNAMKSSKFNDAQTQLKALADFIGADASHPATIPLFRYSFGTKNAESPSAAVTSNKVLSTLNTLTPGVKFEWSPVTKGSWSEFYGAVVSATASTRVSGAGPDYSGAGSINQQLLCSYGTFGEIEYFREALGLVDPTEI